LFEVKHEAEGTSGAALAKGAVANNGAHWNVTYSVTDGATQTAAFLNVGHIEFLSPRRRGFSA
jgi:hypothetical protein